MKKYIFFAILALFPLSTKAETLMGFLDGSLYNNAGVLKYICFMDGNCLDKDNKVATRSSLGLPAVPQVLGATTNSEPTTPRTRDIAIVLAEKAKEWEERALDVCNNIDGIQKEVPKGMVRGYGNNCNQTEAEKLRISSLKPACFAQQIPETKNLKYNCWDADNYDLDSVLVSLSDNELTINYLWFNGDKYFVRSDLTKYQSEHRITTNKELTGVITPVSSDGDPIRAVLELKEYRFKHKTTGEELIVK